MTGRVWEGRVGEGGDTPRPNFQSANLSRNWDRRQNDLEMQKSRCVNKPSLILILFLFPTGEEV